MAIGNLDINWNVTDPPAAIADNALKSISVFALPHIRLATSIRSALANLPVATLLRPLSLAMLNQ